jgi:hypothetical protein
MPIQLALYGTSGDILKQAKNDFMKLSREAKLDLRITLFVRLSDFTRDLRRFDIAAIHENVFFTVLPELTALFKSDGFQSDIDSVVVVGKFTTPVNLKEFMTMVEKMPQQDIALDIPITKGCKTENVSNIIYFENICRRIHIKTAFESYLTTLTMKETQELTAAYSFASPYVSYLVNLKWVERIAERDVIMKNKDIIPLSQKKAALFKQTYREYMSKTQ